MSAFKRLNCRASIVELRYSGDALRSIHVKVRAPKPRMTGGTSLLLSYSLDDEANRNFLVSHGKLEAEYPMVLIIVG